MTARELMDYLWKCNLDYPIVIGLDSEISTIEERRIITSDSEEENRIVIWTNDINF